MSGGQDNYLDGDYVMEMMNIYAKGLVKWLELHQPQELVDIIGTTMMFHHNVNEKFEREFGVHQGRNIHAQIIYNVPVVHINIS